MDTMARSTPGAAIRSFPALSDGGPTRNGAIGLVALATDHVCELDLRQIIPQDRLPLYVGRIGFAAEITVETLGAMRDGITAAASLILAGGRLDVLAYGCTSGTMVIGEDEVFARLRAARPGIACTSPPTAALAALKALRLRRIAVLTPYTASVNRRVQEYFTASPPPASSPRRRRSTRRISRASSCLAPACAASRWSRSSRRSSASRSSPATRRWPGTRCASPAIASRSPTSGGCCASRKRPA